MKNIFTLALVMLLITGAKAQFAWEMGAFTGVSNYSGDLSTNPVPKFKNSAFDFGIIARYAINYNWSIRPGIYVSNLKGDDLSSGDTWRENTRRANFNTRLTEISCLLELEPFGKERFLGGRGFKKLVSPYFFGGVGVALIKPDADFSKTTASGAYMIKVSEDENAKVLNTKIALPLGVGVKFDLSELWLISFEMGARATFSDYLDGVSEAGNPSSNDWYYFTGITIMHRLGESMKN